MIFYFPKFFSPTIAIGFCHKLSCSKTKIKLENGDDFVSTVKNVPSLRVSAQRRGLNQSV